MVEATEFRPLADVACELIRAGIPVADYGRTYGLPSIRLARGQDWGAAVVLLWPRGVAMVSGAAESLDGTYREVIAGGVVLSAVVAQAEEIHA
jgi:hypothetical protein